MFCVRLSLSGFVIMLMFTLLEARNLSKKQQAKYQGIVETKVALQSHNHGGTVIPPNKFAKEIMHDTTQKEVAAEGNVMNLEGRKLANKGGFEKAKMEAKVSSEGSDRGGSENSGAIPTPWNCNLKGKKMLNHVQKNSVRTTTSTINPNKRANKKRTDVFVALSADYKDPRSHPPRHN